MEQRMVDIAASVGKDRPALRRVLIEDGAAVVTDTFRLLLEPLPFKTVGRRYLSVEYLQEDRNSLASWEDLYEAATEDDEYSFPRWQNLIKTGREQISSSLKWDGDGGYRHGRARKEFFDSMREWSHFNGARRKPVGLVKLEVEDGHLFHRWGMSVWEKKNKAMPIFTAFNEHRIPTEASVEDLPNGEIGVYKAEFLASLLSPSMDQITIDAEDPGWRPLSIGYAGGAVGLVMPTRL